MHNIFKNHFVAQEEIKAERKKLFTFLENEGGELSKNDFLYHSEAELLHIGERYVAKREKGKGVIPACSDFEAWLAIGCPKASAPLAHAPIVGPDIELPGHEHWIKMVQGKAVDAQNQLFAFQDYARAVKADSYLVTLNNLSDSSKTYIANGKKPYSPADLMRGMTQFVHEETERKKNIYYTPIPTPEKLHLFIDDVTQEQLTQLHRDGFSPTCIINSSQNNFQALFTLPGTGDIEINRLIGNDIARGLNIRYGDINFTGMQHPHRAPGFHNLKHYYRPEITIIAATGDICKKLTSFISYEKELLAWKKLNKHHSHTHSLQQNELHEKTEINEKIANLLYRLHRNDFIKCNNLNEEGLDNSAADAKIAERLRATGHNKNAIADIFYFAVDKINRNERDWDRYAERLAEYAFSEKAEQNILVMGGFIHSWKALERFAYEEEHAPKNTRTFKGLDIL